MPVGTLLKSGALRVLDYRCSAGPHDRPFVEQHRSFSISYVRRGSFGCVTRGRSFELVAGSFLLGRPDDEYLCTHEHHPHGDECLSFHFDAALLDTLGLPAHAWRSGALPPLAELGVLAEHAQAAAEGQGDLHLTEVGTLLAARFLQLVSGKPPRAVSVTARDRRRAVRVALWLDAHAQEPLDLEQLARQSGVRTFHRAAGRAPRDFRRAAAGRRPPGAGARAAAASRRSQRERKILQVGARPLT